MASNDLGNDFVLFDVGKSGTTATYKFHVSWLTRKFSRSVYMSIRPKGKNRYDKNGNSLVRKYDALMESITGLTVIDYKGNVKPKLHKGIKLHVIWIKYKSGKVLRERTIYADKSDGADIGIDGMLLPAGDYIVTVQALDDDPRFDGTFAVGIAVGYRWE